MTGLINKDDDKPGVEFGAQMVNPDVFDKIEDPEVRELLKGMLRNISVLNYMVAAVIQETGIDLEDFGKSSEDNNESDGHVGMYL